MRADLAALRGGMTLAPTHKDALGLGPDAAPKSDYQSQRFGFAPPDSLEPIRRQALVDALGLYGVPAPLVDERSSVLSLTLLYNAGPSGGWWRRGRSRETARRGGYGASRSPR